MALAIETHPGVARKRRITRASLAVVLLASALTFGLAHRSDAARSDHFRRSGFAGSETATMQQVTVPARIARVETVPGTGGAEVWGIGRSQANLPGWASSPFAGQVVFARYRRGSSWEIIGPPKSSSGAPINADLNDFSIAPSGEGWAVGSSGMMLKRTPGSNDWVKPADLSVSGEGTDQAISFNAVSLTDDRGTVGFATGYVQGTGPTAGTAILRYRDGAWSADELSADMISDGRPQLISVSTVSREEAWAITGTGSSALRVYHRTSAGWSRVNPDPDPRYPVFGGPHPARTKNGGLNDAAFGGVVKARAGEAWIGGALIPRDALRAGGDNTGGDPKRPFVLRIKDGQVTSYCPDIYGAKRVDEGLDPSAICDGAFPFTITEIADIEIAGNEVFAGGMGLFRFAAEGWSREPNSNGYLVSLSFASPSEGWAATSGASVGPGGAASTSENTVGHWTSQPTKPRIARWPQPNTKPLRAVASTQGGIALAVGDEGAVIGYAPEVGWDAIPSPTLGPLNSVAWSAPGTAWIVGSEGTILKFSNGKITESAESGVVTKASLFGVAFTSPTDGIAVGSRGTILRFDGTRWSLDPANSRVTQKNLYAVSANQSAVVAVGAGGTVVERKDGAWSTVGSGSTAATRADGKQSDLNSVAILGDGTVIAGGNKSALIIKAPGGGYSRFGDPVEGNVLAVSGWKDARGLKVFASVDPNVSISAAKFSGDRIAATRSVLMHHDGRVWRDLSLDRNRTAYRGSTDTSAFVDPVLGLQVESPTRGWAAGGIPAIATDEEHLPRTDPTSSIYRFDVVGEPGPGFERANVQLPATGYNFAFFAETWCTLGPCGMTMGTGTHADMVALRIREEIARATSMAGGPKVTVFGGNGRVVGIPEELSEVAGFLDKFPTPVYSAIGNHDLFGGLGGTTVGQTVGNVGSTPGLEFFAPDTSLVEVGSHDYWQQAFAGRHAPWGEGARPGFVDPVDQADIPTLVSPSPGLARTHYAFDYVSGGKARFRLVFVDSSTRSYGKSSDQNPPNEDQRGWLPSVLSDASLRNIPSLVVMNQPTLIPDRTTQFNWKADHDHFMSQVAANRVSAVLTGGARWNIKASYGTEQVSIPGYILGSGGAPLGYDRPTIAAQDPSKMPSDGYYNSWFVINVDPSAPAVLGERLPGQAAVTVIPFPVLDFVSIRSIDGTTAAAGNMLRFAGLAKSLTGGLADGSQSKATYIPVPNASLLDCPDGGQGYGACAARDQVDFPYRFYSENPSIADFVVPAVGGEKPLRDANGRVVRDPTGRHGLLCTFGIGSTYINLESGMQRARKRISVGGGFGPCVDAPVIGPPVIGPFAPPEPAIEEPDPPFRPPPTPPLDVVAAVLPPAPGPIVAPAPPASAAGAKKEEEEAQFEQQGDEGEAEARAMLAPRRRGLDPQTGYALLGTIILLGMMGAMVAASVVERRTKPALVKVHGDSRYE